MIIKRQWLKNKKLKESTLFKIRTTKYNQSKQIKVLVWNAEFAFKIKIIKIILLYACANALVQFDIFISTVWKIGSGITSQKKKKNVLNHILIFNYAVKFVNLLYQLSLNIKVKNTP